MNRRVALAAYQTYAAQTSENVRTLGFGALALVWLFKPDKGYAFPQAAVMAGIFAVTALALDFLQSAVSAITWGYIHRSKEKAGLSEDDAFFPRRFVNWPNLACFGGKVIAILVAYGFLFKFALGVIHESARESQSV